MYIYDRFSVETDNLFTYMYRMIVTRKIYKIAFSVKMTCIAIPKVTGACSSLHNNINQDRCSAPVPLTATIVKS